MKTYIRIVFIAFFAGIIGAYSFSFFNKPVEKIFIQREEVSRNNFANLQSGNNSNAPADFTSASSLCTPSVVYITTVSTYSQNNWFDWYFNWGSSQVTSSGSGVIYSADGYIITNNHVIEKSEKIEVVHEKRTYQAKVVGRDPSTDLALLKVDAENLPAIRLGRSKDLQVGEWVLAVGNPFNLTSTVTAGIVSAKARNINILNSQFPIESFIQTDAAINPGNSGGALVNIKGELVGINTAILSKTGSYTGYGFAVPVDIVSKIVKDLIRYGEVQKAFLGADVSEVNTPVAEKYNLSDLTGVVITYIQKEGAAEKAGLKKGDVVLKMNDYEVNSKSSFDEYLSYFSPGEKVKINYRRDGKLKEATLLLTNREGTTDMLKRETFTSESLGATFESISKVEKEKLSLTHGVRVVSVKNGLIRKLGISEGFIITSINKVSIQTPEELIDIMEKIRGKVVIEGMTSNGMKGYYSYYF